jgi:hypothetical protein
MSDRIVPALLDPRWMPTRRRALSQVAVLHPTFRFNV